MSKIYTVWYMKPSHFRDGMCGILPANDLSTHVKVGEVPMEFADKPDDQQWRDLELIYLNYQAENWSPNGEARPLIEKLGLQHTSMSKGDVVQHGNDFWVVASFGFEKLEHIQVDDVHG